MSTGRLVAEHLLKTYGPDGDLAWAMAGRSQAKLEEVRNLIGAPPSTPLIVADAADPASLEAMVKRTKVIITTVGPYQMPRCPLDIGNRGGSQAKQPRLGRQPASRGKKWHRAFFRSFG